MSTFDVIVIGGGIVGLAVAREVLQRRPGASVALVEKEPTLAAHQSGHNSGVIHSGIYYAEGSLKARLCVDGARRMYDFCAAHGIAHERTGKLIVAAHDGELAGLDALEARGRANGIAGIRRLRAGEIPEVEPHAVGRAALHVPSTGIVDYPAVAQAIADDLRSGGVDIRLGVEVDRVNDRDRDAEVVLANREALTASRVVVCAGAWSDRLARRSGSTSDPRIVPFRGAYLHLPPSVDPVVRGMVYPVPDPTLPFLGVHVTRHVDGHVSLGPTALMVLARDAYRLSGVRSRDAWESIAWPGTWRVARSFWRVGLREMHLAASRTALIEAGAAYVPSLRHARFDTASHAGVRAQAVGRDGALIDDFVISRQGAVTHVRNAPSPAATAAFAIADEIVDRVAL